MIKKKKIAYVSGTRADFGLMKSVLGRIDGRKDLDLHLYATGMHLMPRFGQTVREVKAEFPGTKILRATVASDSKAGMAEYFARVCRAAAREFSVARPDLVLVLGDRPEMLAVAGACLYLGIPVAQLHGGERTGTADELARHAITKLSHLHLAATSDAAARIKKMGEEPARIKVVGAPALDTILNRKLPSRRRLFKILGIKKDLKKFILIALHPVSDDVNSAGRQMRTVLNAAVSFRLPVVAVYPNADAGGRKMIAVLEKYKSRPDFYVFPSVAYENFLALEREAAVWVGNSSAAMIESASFKTPVVNVGTRQRNRLRGSNVIDADYDVRSIKDAVSKSLDRNYRSQPRAEKNPWGDGGTAKRVAGILADLKIDRKFLIKQLTY